MSVRRIGSPESAPEGTALEFYGGKKIVLRAWFTRNGQRELIPAAHFTLDEIAHFLKLNIPKKPYPARRKRPLCAAEEAPT